MAKLHSLVNKGNQLKKYKFVGLFPTEVTPIEVDWGSNDTIEEFSVTLLPIQWWESVADGVDVTIEGFFPSIYFF
jgi:hypothetical protein